MDLRCKYKNCTHRQLLVQECQFCRKNYCEYHSGYSYLYKKDSGLYDKDPFFKHWFTGEQFIACWRAKNLESTCKSCFKTHFDYSRGDLSMQASVGKWRAQLLKIFNRSLTVTQYAKFAKKAVQMLDRDLTVHELANLRIITDYESLPFDCANLNNKMMFLLSQCGLKFKCNQKTQKCILVNF